MAKRLDNARKTFLLRENHGKYTTKNGKEQTKGSIDFYTEKPSDWKFHSGQHQISFGTWQEKRL